MKWSKLLEKAFAYKYKSESYLDSAAQELARECGFSEKEARLFKANFAGCETVVVYNGEGEMADLDLRSMCGLSKEEVLKRLGIDK